MKKILSYIITLVILLFTACSSDSPAGDIIESNTTLRKATFSIKGLTAEMSEMSLKASSLEDMNIQHLEYWVYKTADLHIPSLIGDPVVHKVLSKDDFNKNIVLELPDDDYTIILYAADTEVSIKDLSKRTPYVSAVDIKSQMFSTKKEFIVNEQTPEVNESLTLSRIVGRVEIVIEDLNELPSEVKSITPVVKGVTRIMVIPTMPSNPIGVDLITGGVSWSGGYVYGGKENYFVTIPRSQFSSINSDNPIVIYTLPSRYSSLIQPGSIIPNEIYLQGTTDENFYVLDMQQSLLDQNSKVVFMRSMGRYEVKANQITRYTGKIGSLGEEGFDITIDEDWDEITVGIDE